MDFGIKISKSGVDVKTASGENLILSSSKNCFKMADYLTTTIVVTGGVGTKTIAHGLSFVPVVMAFLKRVDNYHKFPFIDSSDYSIGNYYVNATNIVFQYGGDVGLDGTYTIYYYLSDTESAS